MYEHIEHNILILFSKNEITGIIYFIKLKKINNYKNVKIVYTRCHLDKTII